MTTATYNIDGKQHVEVDWNGECLSLLRWPSRSSSGIVRRTLCGQFAVIEVYGSKTRTVKVLPTLDRARMYNNAVAGR